MLPSALHGFSRDGWRRVARRRAESRHGPRQRRERAERLALWTGLGISALLHVLFVWAAGGVRVDTIPFLVPVVETVPAPDALVVVEIAESLSEADPEDPRPEPTPPEAQEESEIEPDPRELEVVQIAPDEGRPVPRVPGIDAPGRPSEPREGEGVSNASRLTLRYSDSRLWFDPRDPLLFGDRLARFARADSAVRAILRDWLDSLRLTDEQRRRATDWTFEKDGKRWGISPEGIHLGDITIPIPISFAPSGPQRRQFEQAIRDLTEIQLQDLRVDVEAAAAEARERMRERADEEIRRRRGGDTLQARAPP